MTQTTNLEPAEVPTEDKLVIGFHASIVQYGEPEEIAVPIQDLIDALLEAQEDGATHVVEFTGNHRGARYARPSVSWSFLRDDDGAY